jgi:hypothetical protein
VPGQPRLFAFAAVEGSGRASSRGAVWQRSVCALPWRIDVVSSQGLAPLEGLRGMGTRGACFTSSRSRVTFSRRYPIEGCFRLSQGLAPLEGFTWHGCPRCLLYIERVPGGLLTSISHRGLFLSGAEGSCRSRVLRGMGARGACSRSSESRAAFSRRYPVEGHFCFEPRARAARGFYVAWVPAVPALHRAGPGRPSHVDIPSRAVFVSS